MALKAARSSLSKVKYRSPAPDSFFEKKAIFWLPGATLELLQDTPHMGI
jgi:hypothetical protein